MNAIRTLGLASAAALALGAASSASAADYLFDFQFDALTSSLGDFAATNIVYAADNLDPATLTYVSGDVNGAASPELFLHVFGGPSGQRGYSFSPADYSVPEGSIADIFFSVLAPLSAGATQETTLAGRAVRTSSGGFFLYTTGRLTITEVAAAVPEPATWATMIVGFLLVGGALRRRAPIRSVRIAYS